MEKRNSKVTYTTGDKDWTFARELLREINGLTD